MMMMAAWLSLTATAQTADDGAQRAERMFGYVLRNEADSLYAAMAPEVKKMVQPVQLKDALAQAEVMAGRYVKHGPWTRQDVGSTSVYTSTVTFERTSLAALVAFDDEGRMTGIRLLPSAMLELEDGTDEALPDDAVEMDDMVLTGEEVRLPAVLTLSGRSAEPPMVVMVHGSGPLDRDETVMANKTFRDLALQLAQQGISTLRYDKRTFAYPGQRVTTMDEETVLDALSAIRLARTYSNKVYVLGHSLGAMLAPAIAARAEGDVQGIVMMAAPARDMEQLVKDQVAYLMPDFAEAVRQQSIAELHRQAPHYFAPQHQVEAVQALTLPILVMQGERDYQVSMTDFRLWQQALQGRQNARLRSYPDLNHLFLPGAGPSTPQEYLVRKNIPQEVIDDIARFVFGQSF